MADIFCISEKVAFNSLGTTYGWGGSLYSDDCSGYKDVNEMSEYAISGIRYVIGKDIMKGKTNTEFCPKDSATRAEVATIIERFVLFR